MKFFINLIVGATLALVVALPAHAQNSMPSAYDKVDKELHHRPRHADPGAALRPCSGAG